jgi:hypothetical protein
MGEQDRLAEADPLKKRAVSLRLQCGWSDRNDE